MKPIQLYVIILIITASVSCREDDVIFIPETVVVSKPGLSDVKGFYLLNEGNMGSNKSTLDYYDFSMGVYTRNIYGSANPDVPKELGDVGNDLAIYGTKLYAVINCSNKIEVMNTLTAKRITQINIPNCRYIKFYDGYAYVTSYAGPVEINPEYEQRGYVAKVDTTDFSIVDTCLVGFQPDELEIIDDKIYVANSGGYMVPNYENTVSVIDIATFKEEERVHIAINLQCVSGDKYGGLWVSSRGDYYDNPSRLYCYDVRKKRIEKEFDVPVSSMWLDGDSLYVISVAWSNITMSDDVTYAIINVKTREVVTRNFITDGTDLKIKKPYGIAVNPITKDIYVTDAKNYVNPGTLYCFGQDGVMKWSVRTGDIPAHFAFVGE